MHSILPLISGIAGAESGSASIYKRGTSTLATYYSTFEGSVHSTSAATLTLDSKGGAEVYVNELVDVVVVGSTGTTVRNFVAGSSSGNVEVRSQSFTGTDYDDASSAANDPTTAQAIFDLWKTNAGNAAGSIDWKVTSGGDTKTLASWMGALAGSPVYNVRDVAYGATGDGSTDDLAAIDLATAAAQAAGGGIVFFPEGTYSISGVIAMPALVSILGAGMESTTIQVDHATERGITVTDTTYGTFISGLRITAGEANTGACVDFLGACETVLSNCYIGGSDNNTARLVDSTAEAQRVTIRDCTFEPGASTTDCITCDLHTSGRYLIDTCRFVLPASYTPTNAIIYGNLCDVRDCVFETGSCTSGTVAVFKSDDNNLNSSVIGCYFETSGGATVTCITLGTYDDGCRFMESGNIFPLQTDSNSTAYSYTVTAADTDDQVILATRESRHYYISDNSATLTVPSDQYGRCYVRRSGNSLCVYTLSNAPHGATLTFTVINNHGATTGNQQYANLGGFSSAHTIQNNRFDGCTASTMSAATANKWYVTGFVQDAVV